MARGSQWNRWDLHVHTPESIVHGYKAHQGLDVWESFIKGIEDLPPDIKVIGINDYYFLDGYKRVLQAKSSGRMSNIDRFFPVVEFRVDRFGGHDKFKRINYHVIFSDELDPEIIEQQFLNSLSSSYTLSPHYVGQVNWHGTYTRRSLEDLGHAIINSVPEEERSRYGTALQEGFNNLNVSLDMLKERLENSYVKGKFLTGVGKAEWSDFHWNDNSIAEKKTIINDVDFVFTAAESPESYFQALKSLKDQGVHSRLLDCSDSHKLSDSPEKDRLGNCFTWIKADTTFEGLRQALYEFDSRVLISTNKPVEPVYQIQNTTININSSTVIRSKSDNETDREDPFCFAGNYEIEFSPFFTCVIGGRGSGKSTLLGMMGKKANPEFEFFPNRRFISDGEPVRGIQNYIQVNGSLSDAEFISQNEIEQLALRPDRLTAHVYSRVLSSNLDGSLQKLEDENAQRIRKIQIQAERITRRFEIEATIDQNNRKLEDLRRVVSSLEAPEFLQMSDELRRATTEMQELEADSTSLISMAEDISAVVAKFEESSRSNDFALSINRVRSELMELADQARNAFEKGKEFMEGKRASVGHLREQLDQFLASKGVSLENASGISGAYSEISSLEIVLTNLFEEKRALGEQIDAFDYARGDVSVYENKIRDNVSAVFRSLSDLSTYVRAIEAGYSFDASSAKNELVTRIPLLTAENNRRSIRGQVIERWLESIDIFHEEAYKEFIDLCNRETSGTSRMLQQTYESPLSVELLRLLFLEVTSNVNEFKRIDIFYGGKSLDHSSFGQRCTAVLVTLLLLGNKPIVIDEPEAHLDSALIANYLVNVIKSRKQHRQIIFATHNANFVVNGDADLIINLELNDDPHTHVEAFTIEDLGFRSKLLALEGGREAFRQRELRYQQVSPGSSLA